MNKNPLEAAALLLAFVLSACGSSADVSPVNQSTTVPVETVPTPGTSSGAAACSGALAITTLSNRADLISDGNALVLLTLPAGTDPSKVTVIAAGKDVSSKFAVRASGCDEALLEGLPLGSSDLIATLANGSATKLTVINHPNGGPVFSGPQITPWACNTAGATDSQCNHPVAYSFFYSTGTPVAVPASLPVGVPAVCHGNANLTLEAADCGFAPYDPANPPSSVPMVTTDQGTKVPYIVRVETGYQDRDVYHIAVLFNPNESWTAFDPQLGWNHKVLVTQGAGCGNHFGEGEVTGTGPSPQGALASNWPGVVLDDAGLSKGFAVISTALTNSTHNCNHVVQAESVMMAKERLIENYGAVRYTIAQGCSGGSLSQYRTAAAYPGIYQGLLPSCTFPDAWSTGSSPYDCFLLENYWKNPAGWAPGLVWTPDNLAAVAGSETASVCLYWIEVYSFYPTIYPQKSSPVESKAGALDLQNCGILATDAFDALLNPSGVRCSLSDHESKVVGLRPDGIANRPLENQGVQYGLVALQSGTITPAQFADINQKVGSRDINWVQQTSRNSAEPAGFTNAYRTGGINETTHLNKVAIIDLSAGTSDIHESWRAFAIRARMDAAYGNHDNDVIWYTSTTTAEPLATLDQWLTAVEADTTSAPLEQKIVKDKPAGLKDIIDLPVYLGTRGAAGEGMARDIMKCQLKPLSRTDYSVTFSDDEWAQLVTAFPDGVCDWSKPGIGQQPNIAWQQYGTDSTPIYGGTPLPPVPESTIIH